MKIIDIHSSTSGLLKSSITKGNASSLTRFLPSIVITNEDENQITFLMAYRVWKREGSYTSLIKNPGNKGHPWYNRWGYSSFDGTAFAKIVLDKINDTITIENDKIPSVGNSKIDTRLLQNPKDKNKFFITYNSFGKLNPLLRKEDYTDFNNKTSCFYIQDDTTIQYNPSNTLLIKSGISPHNYKSRSHCTFQNISTLTFKSNSPIFSKPSLVCPQHHNIVEKNISMYWDESVHKIGYQYSLMPWTIFKPGCVKEISKNTLFQNIADYYDNTNNYFSKIIQFSCSTPLVPYNENTLIAAGHFKIHYNDIDKIPHKSLAYSFCKKMLKVLKIPSFSQKHEGIIHYELIYGSFLYTVNKKTMRLKKSSNCFIVIDKKPHALMFPCGLVKSMNNDMYLSYHENDINMKLLRLSIKEVDKLLIHKSSTSPSEMDFEIWKI
jgi:hypothetical protein